MSEDVRRLRSDVVEAMLQAPPHPEAPPLHYPRPPASHVKRLVLARTLFRIFQRKKLDPFTPAQFRDAIKSAVQEEGVRQNEFGEWVDAYETQFCDHSRLVRVEDGSVLDDRFLEFLAGEGLAQETDFAVRANEGLTNVADWREVIRHACWAKAVQHAVPGDVRDLLEALARHPERGQPCPPESLPDGARTKLSALRAILPTTDLGWRKVVLAGEVVRDLGVAALELDQPGVADCLKLVRERLAALIKQESLPENRQGREGLKVHERAYAGEVLGWIGDPRPGVGVGRVLVREPDPAAVGPNDSAPRFRLLPEAALSPEQKKSDSAFEPGRARLRLVPRRGRRVHNGGRLIGMGRRKTCVSLSAHHAGFPHQPVRPDECPV